RSTCDRSGPTRTPTRCRSPPSSARLHEHDAGERAGGGPETAAHPSETVGAAAMSARGAAGRPASGSNGTSTDRCGAEVSAPRTPGGPEEGMGMNTTSNNRRPHGAPRRRGLIIALAIALIAAVAPSLTSSVGAADPAKPVAMRLLVIAADGNETDYPAITTFLDEVGV